MPEYCKRCGSFMKVKETRGDVVIYECPVCHWTKEVTNSKVSQERSAIVLDKPVSMMVVIDEAKIKRRGTIVKVQCPKCGNLGAYVEIVQTRAADEPPTRIYKCTKCGYTWREYS
ncbi:MAG: transcription factor S [Candidatus Njordarchaeales archaeon]